MNQNYNNNYDFSIHTNETYVSVNGDNKQAMSASAVLAA